MLMPMVLTMLFVPVYIHASVGSNYVSTRTYLDAAGTDWQQHNI